MRWVSRVGHVWRLPRSGDSIGPVVDPWLSLVASGGFRTLRRRHIN